MKTCSVKGCLERYNAKGLCKKHYMARWHQEHINYRIIYNAKYNRDHKREILNNKAQYYRNNRFKILDKWFFQEYGMTPGNFESQLDSQNGVCGICGSKSTRDKRKNRFCADHEHVEGYEEMPASEKMRYFRGLLCQNCNNMLREGHDNIESLQKLIDYLIDCPNKESTLKYIKGSTSNNDRLRDILIAKFGNHCQANTKHSPSRHGIFLIDHNHKTGKVRGLLCDGCNCVLGHAKDNIKILEKAIEYLENYQNRNLYNIPINTEVYHGCN